MAAQGHRAVGVCRCDIFFLVCMKTEHFLGCGAFSVKVEKVLCELARAAFLLRLGSGSGFRRDGGAKEKRRYRERKAG